jgi:allantoinase
LRFIQGFEDLTETLRRITIRSRRVVLPDGERAAMVSVDEAGRIERVGAYSDADGGEVIDAGDLVLMPGLVDTHVHVNEPGRTEWEGFDTATRAAAAGGITTIVDMPLNSVPATTTIGALDEKRRAAAGRIHVDVGFWGGVVPGNHDHLLPLARAGVLGFKCFLTPSGVDEFPHVDEADVRRAAPALVEGRSPLLVHAETPSMIDADWGARSNPASYRAYAASRPVAAESSAIRMIADVARDSGLVAHIVHVTSEEGCAEIDRARHAGLPLTGETCPHYLFASAEDIPDGATLWKCAPPIRPAVHREALWTALRRGTLSLVASDHSPSPRPMKCVESGDFQRAWGGIASLQLALSIVWTAAQARGYALNDIVRWMSLAPAALAGLTGRKGAIAIGADADLIVWDPHARFVVDPALLHHRHPITPYAGRELKGRVEQTWLRGRLIYDRGSFTGSQGAFVARLH